MRIIGLIFALLVPTLAWGSGYNPALNSVVFPGGPFTTAGTGSLTINTSGATTLNVPSGTNTIPAVPVSQLQGGTDYSPAELPNWRAAIAKVAAGTANTNVLVIGDSTTIGINATGTYFPQNFTYFLAADLTAAGIPANNNGWCGMSTGGSNTGSRASEDTRITPGSWNTNTFQGLGGYFVNAGGTTASPFVYAPGVSTNTFQALIYNAGGSVTLTATGGTPVTNTYGPGISTSTITAGSLSASNTLSATEITASTSILCEGAYNSATKQVNIYNAGWWGTASGLWAANVSTISYLAPSLTIIRCCINDNGVTAPATVVANITTIVTAAKAVGDVLIDDENPASGQTGAAAINAAVQTYAVANNIPFVDSYGRWANNLYASALGSSYYSDGFHPTSLGYYGLARADAKVLSAP
jgi:lysophospholipase L1-like esterase